MGATRLALLGLALLVGATTGCGARSSAPPALLFLSDRDGGWALYTMAADGGVARRAFAPGQVFPSGEAIGSGEPLVSPDGRKVMLARNGIAVVSLATGKQLWHGAGEESGAGWSPDSKRLVFGGGGLTGRTGGMFIVDLGSGRRTTLIPSADESAPDHVGIWTPAWSPDGRWIVFARQVGYGPEEVELMRPDGTRLTHLTGWAPWEGRLAWSPDSKRVAFIGVPAGKGDHPARLVIVAVSTHKVEVRQEASGGVAWSPDGHLIATAGIAVFDANGLHRRALTASKAAASDTSPIWAPDGKSLVFVRTPLGRDADTYISQLWTVRADGSHAHPLTRPFPDSGTSIEPSWVHGAVHREPARRPAESHDGRATVLRVPFAVDGVAAAAGRAAVVPLGHAEQHDVMPTPPILLWRPRHGVTTRLSASPCGVVAGTILTADRLVFDCGNSFFDESEDSIWVADPRRLLPRAVFDGNGLSTGVGQQGLFVDGIAGDGRLVAFATERGKNGRTTHALWRVSGFDSLNIGVGAGRVSVVAAAAGLVAVALPNGDVQLLRADGTSVRVLRFARDRSQAEFAPMIKLTGGELLRLDGRRLQAFSTADGRLRWQRRVPAGATLEAAADGLIVYAAGSALHILTGAKDTILRTGAGPLPRDAYQLVHAALAPDGLYYSFDVADKRFPGRVVFVPRAALR